MRRISTTALITISLTSILASVVFASSLLGLFPNDAETRIAGRKALAESLALHCTQAISRRDAGMIKETLETAVRRNGDLISARFEKSNGDILLQAGPSVNLEQGTHGYDIVNVPLFANAQEYGRLILAFQSSGTSFRAVLKSPILRFALFLTVICGLVFQLYLKRVLKHLDPSAVVPNRVRMTLDTLAEGLVVLDDKCQVVLVNQAIATILGKGLAELQGLHLSDFTWRLRDAHQEDELPWEVCIRECRVVSGVIMELELTTSSCRKFRVTCSPISHDKAGCQGALVSLDDVTALEDRTLELTKMLEKLRESREQIRQQNQQLLTLATRDPLTSAFNRRHLFEQLDVCWSISQESGEGFSCIMADIDHFKCINDGHGHAVGDLVLKKTVELFHAVVRPKDIVGRYGGEEFCIVLPDTDLATATELAEEIRCRIQDHDFQGLRVTASFGIASTSPHVTSSECLMELADRSLYMAKRTGRNRVVSCEQLEELEAANDVSAVDPVMAGEHHHAAIPFQTVAALTAALAYRDVETAQHSRRVADWCFAMGSEMMSISKAYILENAALLHDIGKIGVPDRVLLKPGALTEEEWELMKMHDRIGVEIIRSTFACDELTEIVQYHHAKYGGDLSDQDELYGKDLPLGARILTVADSFDAMISDRVYRKGLPRDVAFQELRRCAGTQFDPDLVEHFIDLVRRTTAVRQFDESAPPVSGVDKQTALRLGMQIEDLAQALDERDAARLSGIASEIGETATNFEVSQVAELAEELRGESFDNTDWVKVIELTIDLMEMCRTAQMSHLNTDVNQNQLTLETLRARRRKLLSAGALNEEAMTVGAKIAERHHGTVAG